ncbi:hypothetical protein ES695_00920 [Candidatus Atribacteria bacterium 1244-E10-H5-B2]|nr:MAG: hypothetical protein ES695_00920 [Candidatus Atribacteria bacterium 1244-E10-H5-B2]
MPLTSDTVEELNRLIDIFFEKIGRKERLRKQMLKLLDECEAYLYPKIREWLQGTREQIIKDIRKKILKKGAELGDLPASFSLIYISGKGPAEIRKKSKPQIVVDYVDWEMIESRGKSTIKPAYLSIMEKSGNLAREQGRIEASFDVINPRSVEWAEKYSYELISLVEKETKKGIRRIVSQGLKEGKTLTQVARDIEHLKDVGLNGRQSTALLKYRRTLEAQKLPKELYLQKYTKRYDRLLRDRSKLIARTEVSRSVNEGYLDSLEGTRYDEVEISSAGDACSLCLDLAGIKFKRSEARGRLPVHPNCRCHWIVVIPRKVKKPKVPKKPEVKLPGWRPAKTKSEAYSFAHKELVKEYGLVDYGKIDLKGINIVNKELFRLIEKYKIKLNNIGSSQGLSKTVTHLYGRTTPNSTFANVWFNRPTGQISMTFNEYWWATPAKRKFFKDSMYACVRAGFHKTDTFKGVIAHEYGHVLDILDVTRRVSSTSEVMLYLRETDVVTIKNIFGDYANKESAEFWAEAFCNYEAKNLPKKEMNFVAKIIKKYIPR